MVHAGFSVVFAKKLAGEFPGQSFGGRKHAAVITATDAGGDKWAAAYSNDGPMVRQSSAPSPPPESNRLECGARLLSAGLSGAAPPRDSLRSILAA